MKTNEAGNEVTLFELTAGERDIVLYVRSMGIDRHEALRRLGTSALPPVLPAQQELHANMPAVAQDPTLVFRSADASRS